MEKEDNSMRIPKSVSDREKWARCRNCNGTELACKGLARDRTGRGCCHDCNHKPEEEPSNGDE